ncbi:MAG TPA: DUF4142 domain-containing protein [Kofleriaceae bacterium]|nr:DUF4142 domain-containing protein [Kofleriaceae bacterium]
MMFPKKIARYVFPFAMICFGVAGTAVAQPLPENAPPPMPQQPTQAEQAATESALAQLHAINQFETRAGMMALNRAKSKAVIDYASEIAEDHQELDQRVLLTANQLDIKVADSPQAAQKLAELKQSPAQQRLTQVSGTEFDRAFIDAMVAGHESAIQTLQAARAGVQNTQAAQTIDDALKTIQGHLDEARKLQRQLGVPQQSGGW